MDGDRTRDISAAPVVNQMAAQRVLRQKGWSLFLLDLVVCFKKFRRCARGKAFNRVCSGD